MAASTLGSFPSPSDRALRFLERDPLLNYSAAHAILHGRASAVALAESGEALVGVAVTGQVMGGGPPPVYLDAIGPIALRRLLATLRRPPRRIVVAHRSWLEHALEREIGALRLRCGVALFAGESIAPEYDLDPRVQPLTLETIWALRSQSAAWNLNVLAAHLAHGGEALGVVRDSVLIAHAAYGLPVGALEEISHLYTAPPWRGQGLAQALTLTAMRAIEARGRRPVYRSRTENAASRHVAERCGLVHVATIRELAVEGWAGRPRPRGRSVTDSNMDKERRE